MTAVACLKIFVADELQAADPERIANLTAKVAGAYFETTWLWPRRYGQVAPHSFVLADPRATALDARELQGLARDLQHKLFGDVGDGEITLLMFEGNQADIMRFSGMTAKELSAILSGEDDGLLAGRVCRITTDEVTSIVPKDGPVTGQPSMEQLAQEAPTPEPARVVYRGVYHTGRETFIGNVAVWRETPTANYGFEPVRADGDQPEYDIPTLEGGLEAVRGLSVGIMFFPISFSSIVKMSTRAELLPWLEALPRAKRGQLAAAVYETPRAPSFWALSQLKTYLEPFFGRIDLRVTDPAFQIDDLPPGLADSVTLVLPKTTEAARLKAITRFMKEAPVYQRRRVRQGISDVTTKRELNSCIEYAAPFLTGPAVTDMLEKPARGVACPVLDLPLHDWSQQQADFGTE